MIVTLCGSTAYKPLFEKIEREFALSGDIVLSLSVFSKYDNVALTDEEIQTLVELHFHKIDMADIVYVICPEGRVGEHTLAEIEYAKKKNKMIFYDKDIK